MTATLFTILPSKSVIPYDPWADVSGPIQGTEDGTINMRDISYLIQMFGQSGNTTKDVSVTNWLAQEEVVWIGDWVQVFENDSMHGGYTQYGQSYPIHVGGYEKVTIFFEFPDNLTYLDEMERYVEPDLMWYINLGFSPRDSTSPSGTTYSIRGGAFPYGVQPIHVGSYPIKAPYLRVAPIFRNVVTQGYPSYGFGNVTVSIYLYLSNGPIASSTRDTMQWRTWKYISDSNPVGIGGPRIRGFSRLDLTLCSNATWNVIVIIGDRFDSFVLSGTLGYIQKSYDLYGGSDLGISLTNPSTTPNYVSVSASVIA